MVEGKVIYRKNKRNANLYVKGEMIGRIEKEFTYYACVATQIAGFDRGL